MFLNPDINSWGVESTVCIDVQCELEPSAGQKKCLRTLLASAPPTSALREHEARSIPDSELLANARLQADDTGRRVCSASGGHSSWSHFNFYWKSGLPVSCSSLTNATTHSSIHPSSIHPSTHPSFHLQALVSCSVLGGLWSQSQLVLGEEGSIHPRRVTSQSQGHTTTSQSCF